MGPLIKLSPGRRKRKKPTKPPTVDSDDREYCQTSGSNVQIEGLPDFLGCRTLNLVRQVYLEVDGRDFYMYRLFSTSIDWATFVTELQTGNFQPEAAGKLRIDVALGKEFEAYAVIQGKS